MSYFTQHNLENKAPKEFMNEFFLLQSPTSVKLFQKYAKDAPIFDYHCHISPADIASNKRFSNITELWLGGDHYKWRALRSNGIDEYFITGGATDREKFQKWAELMPLLLGNPLFHWTHLELQRYFGIHEMLNADTAESIWKACNEQISEPGFTAKQLIVKSNVRVICTTDDPTDTLEHHMEISADTDFPVRVLPTFRPDKALYPERTGFVTWIAKLGLTVGYPITTLHELMRALSNRMDLFQATGCRLADHSLEPVCFERATEAEADILFRNALAGDRLDKKEIRKYHTWVMVWLGRQYARLSWTMQLHMSAKRNNNTMAFRTLGPDTGFDTMGDDNLVEPLSKLLDAMDMTGELPKTILYSLNSKDLEALASLSGCFQDSGVPGKIQLGASWWFNDQRDGIEHHFKTLGNMGVLGRFVGMLTDSRSLLSYPRHEYFRRILCNLIGGWIESGELPDHEDLFGGIIVDICYRNAESWFGF